MNVVEFINGLQDRINLTGLFIVPTKCGCKIRDMYSGHRIYVRAEPGCPEYFRVRLAVRDVFVLLRPDEIRELLLTGNFPDWWTLENRILEEKRRKKQQNHEQPS